MTGLLLLDSGWLLDLETDLAEGCLVVGIGCLLAIVYNRDGLVWNRGFDLLGSLDKTDILLNAILALLAMHNRCGGDNERVCLGIGSGLSGCAAERKEEECEEMFHFSIGEIKYYSKLKRKPI